MYRKPTPDAPPAKSAGSMTPPTQARSEGSTLQTPPGSAAGSRLDTPAVTPKTNERDAPPPADQRSGGGERSHPTGEESRKEVTIEQVAAETGLSPVPLRPSTFRPSPLSTGGRDAGFPSTGLSKPGRLPPASNPDRAPADTALRRPTDTAAKGGAQTPAPVARPFKPFDSRTREATEPVVSRTSVESHRPSGGSRAASILREVSDSGAGRQSAERDRGDIPLRPMTPRAPLQMREVIRNNPRPSGQLPSAWDRVASAVSNGWKSAGAAVRLRDTNGLETNKYAFGPIATANVSIRHTLTKEQSFARLRETRIPLPKLRPTYLSVRNVRADMNNLLQGIENKLVTAQNQQKLKDAAAETDIAGDSPQSAAATVAPADSAAPAVSAAVKVSGKREKPGPTPGVGAFIAANPGRLRTAQADRFNAIALELNEVSNDLKAATVARDNLNLLPVEETKGKAKAQADVSVAGASDALVPRAASATAKQLTAAPDPASPEIIEQAKTGNIPLAKRPGMEPVPADKHERDVELADKIVDRVQQRVAELKAALTQGLRKETTERIEGLAEFDKTDAAATKALQGALHKFSDEAFNRESDAAIRSTMPRHEVEVLMEALRGGVKEGNKIDPAHALDVMKEMRTSSLETLMQYPGADPATLTPDQQRVNKVMSRLNDVPYGRHIIKQLAKQPSGKGPQISAADKKLANGIQMEAMHTLLRAERIKEDLSGLPGYRAATSTDLQNAQKAAIKRFLDPKTALDEREQSQYNLVRSGLIGRNGNRDDLNAAADILNSFQANLKEQTGLKGSAGPNEVFKSIGTAARAIRNSDTTARGLITNDAQQRRKFRESASAALDKTVLHYKPVSAFNPATANAINQTISSYSADETAKTVVRMDAYLQDIRGKVEQAALDHIRAATTAPITKADQDRYLRILADVAVGSFAKDEIAKAKNTDNNPAAENIRPEHFEIAYEPAQRERNPAVHDIRQKMVELLARVNLDVVPPADGDNATFAERARDAADEALGRNPFPLTKEHLFEQVSTIRELPPLPASAAAPGALAAPGRAGPSAGNAATLAAAAADSLREAGQAQQKYQDTMPAPPIREVSYEALRETLYAFVQQSELRNKLRVTTVEIGELNAKPFSGSFPRVTNKPLDVPADASDRLKNAADHFTAGPAFKVRLEGMAGKAQFIEVANALDGFEIYIGTEERTALATGGNLGGTAGLTTPAGSARFIGQADSARVAETIRHTGVKLSIARSTIGEFTEEEMRVENRKLVDALLPPEGPQVAAAMTAGGNPTVHLEDIMAKCPHVTVNLIQESADDNKRYELTPTAGASFGVFGDGALVGATLTAGGQQNWTWRDTLHREKTGSTMTNKMSSGSGTSTQRVFNFGANAAKVFSSPSGALGFALGSASKAKQLGGTVQEHKYKFVTESGLTLPPNSRNEREFSRGKQFFQFVDKNYESIVAHTINTRYKDHNDLDALEKRQCAVEDIETLKSVVAAIEGNDRELILRNVIAASDRITDSAARQRDILFGEQAVLAQTDERLGDNHGREDELRDSVAEKWKALEELADRAGSWTSHRLTGSERTSYQDTMFLDYVIKAGTQNQSDAQRALFSFPQ
jgi:hypothetical protein